MALTYEAAVALLKKRATKKLAPNTYLHRVDDNTLAVRLYETDVVLIHADGRYTLSDGNGEFKTATTKDRINAYSPARVYADGGLWYVGETTVFADGIVVDSRGDVLSGGRNAYGEVHMKRRLDGMVRKYVKGFCQSVASARSLDSPGPGDCFMCQMGFGGVDHLFSHFEESYYVPSLLFRAVEKCGDPQFVYRLMMADAERGRTDMISPYLSSYFRKLKPEMLDYLREQQEAAA